jgi:hypothetical protein
MKMRVLVVMGLGLMAAAPAAGKDTTHLYTTGAIVEIDRCASAWLIKRYVDPEAKFKLIPDGALVTEGTAFDTPDARLSRNHHQSTFEVIKAVYKINDPRIDQLAMHVNDLEINYWGKKKSQRSQKIALELNRIIKGAKDSQAALLGCFEYLDQLIDQTN